MTLLEKIKAVFNGDEKKAQEFMKAAEKLKETMKFMEYKLADGTAIKVEPELSQGSAIVLADGTPAPDGEHMMEGGVKIKVSGGVIQAIEKEEMKDVAAMEAQLTAMKAENEAFKAEMEALKTTVAGLKFASQDEFNNLKTVVSKMVDALELDGKGKQEFKAEKKEGGEAGKPMPVWMQMAQRYSEM